MADYRSISRPPKPTVNDAAQPPVVSDVRNEARPPAQTVEDAEARYWEAYGPHLLDAFFGEEIARPETIEDWRALAKATSMVLKARIAAAALIRKGPKE